MAYLVGPLDVRSGVPQEFLAGLVDRPCGFGSPLGRTSDTASLIFSSASAHMLRLFALTTRATIVPLCQLGHVACWTEHSRLWIESRALGGYLFHQRPLF